MIQVNLDAILILWRRSSNFAVIACAPPKLTMEPHSAAPTRKFDPSAQPSDGGSPFEIAVTHSQTMFTLALDSGEPNR